MTNSITLYHSEKHDCSYRPKQISKTLFVDPNLSPDHRLYNTLLEHGFRRSGGHIYRPDCEKCQACIPMRLPVEKFKPKRSQRRIWAKNAPHLEVVPRSTKFRQEHFELYCRYQNSRHPGGDMANATPDGFSTFLASKWSETQFIELHLAGRLAAVTVTDLLPTGLSAIYTFFDPDLSHHSPGTLALLWQIQEAKRRRLPWLYLGYWIPDCQKMSYKNQYRPLQVFSQGKWCEFSRGETIKIPGII